jgi:hypothetical protein
MATACGKILELVIRAVMPATRSHRSFGAITGWWATDARALALVLAFVVAAPTAGLAADLVH